MKMKTVFFIFTLLCGVINPSFNTSTKASPPFQDEKNSSVTSYDFKSFLSKKSGALFFFITDTKRYYNMAALEPGRHRLSFHKGQRYNIYFVPDDLNSNSIVICSGRIDNQESIENTLEMILRRSEKHSDFHDWEACIQRVRHVFLMDHLPPGIQNNYTNSRDIILNLVTRQIVDSDGLILLLLNLGEISRNNEYKKSMIVLLDRIYVLYFGIEYEEPFALIALINSDVPDIMKRLRNWLKSYGSPEKIEIVINILSNFSNLRMLQYYLQGEPERVSRQNWNYFCDLEE